MSNKFWDKFFSDIVEMDSIVSNTGASSGDSVKIHPLVILNISDHFTRVRAQNSMQVSNSARHVASVQVRLI